MLRKELVTAIIVSILLVSVPSCAKTDSIETEEIESTITNLVRPSESDIKPSEDSHRRVDESTVQSSEVEVEETDPYVINGIRIKTEEEIENELVNHPDFFPYQTINVNSFEIERRQTNVDAMTDSVWVNVGASNENINCSIQYEMTYNLYNEGWMLDAVVPYERDNWTIVPLQGPSYDQAYAALQDILAETHFITSSGGIAVPQSSYNYSGGDCEFSDETAVYYFYRHDDYAYASQDTTDAIYFEFDDSTVSWVYDSIEYGVEVNTTWHASGTYYGWYSAISSYSIEITQIDNQTIHVTVYESYYDGTVTVIVDKDETLESWGVHDYESRIVVTPIEIQYDYNLFTP